MKKEKLSINELKNKAKVLDQKAESHVKGGFIIGTDIVQT